MKPLFTTTQDAQDFKQMITQLIYQKVCSTRSSDRVNLKDVELSSMTLGKYMPSTHKAWVVEWINSTPWHISQKQTPDILGRAYPYPGGIYIVFSPQLEGYLFRYAFPLKNKPA